jgi:ADP-dependent NAD(P)H-hydrate dehydratase / NAD(P)H-hydrate epimerase
MKIFATKQIAEIDKFTIENEPIADIDLMERAAMQITNWLVQRFSTEQKMVFLAGPGNNGGDALAIARQMAYFDYNCEAYLLNFGKDLKGSPAINWKRLEDQGKVKLVKIGQAEDFPKTEPADVLIDGLFGSGLSRPLEGLPAGVVKKMNALPNTTVAIDIPSGMMGEDNSGTNPEHIVRANFTLTFQFPKISFLFAENELFTGIWEVLPIGLHPEGIAQTLSDFYFIEKKDIKGMIPARSKFAHKGTFGHALLIAGSCGKMGASVLASKACLRSGVGLLTAHVPHFGYSIIQTTVPEAMVSIDDHDSIFTGMPDLTPFTAIGVGPGIGLKSNTKKALKELFEKAKVPLVLDADALNILAENKDWLHDLPENSILTPHPGEFKRLAGESENSWQQIQKQLQMAKELKVIIVLKGAFTTITLPNGKLYFNSTGNPGMATAGSGDSLTGIILGLVAQHIPPEHAAIAGVFLHGLAGDLAACNTSENALIAGDITDFLGEAFLAQENRNSRNEAKIDVLGLKT